MPLDRVGADARLRERGRGHAALVATERCFFGCFVMQISLHQYRIIVLPPLRAGGWLTGKFEREVAPPADSRVAFAEEKKVKLQSHPTYSQYAGDDKVRSLVLWGVVGGSLMPVPHCAAQVWELIDALKQVATETGLCLGQFAALGFLSWLTRANSAAAQAARRRRSPSVGSFSSPASQQVWAKRGGGSAGRECCQPPPPFPPSVVIGARKLEQLDDNCKAAAGSPLSEAQMQLLADKSAVDIPCASGDPSSALERSPTLTLKIPQPDRPV